MALRDKLKAALSLFGPRQRQVWFGPRRAHFEIRDVDLEEMGWLRIAIETELGAIPHVEWVELNPYTRRVAVAYEENAVDRKTLECAFERAEHAAFCAARGFRQHDTAHPADIEQLRRLLVELVADTAGLAVAAALRLSPVPASHLSGTAASLLALAKSSPWLRKGIDDRLGAERTELLANLGIAIGNGFSQRTIAALVDAVHKALLLREARARHRTWNLREPELFLAPSHHDPRELEGLVRPCELPDGPIEQYADRAWMVALGGFAFSFLTTRSVQRAVAALFGGVPKPARLGRDVFSAGLSVHLSQRQVLVMDPEAIRRLDRVSCLVIAADVLPKDRFTIVDVLTTGELTRDQAHERIRALLDADQPLLSQSDGEYELAVLGLLPVQDDSLSETALNLAQAGMLVMQLFCEQRRVAVCAVELLPQTGLEELVSAAQRADLRVVVADDGHTALEHVAIDDRIAPGENLCDWVRRLQSEGEVVAVVACSDPRALAASDCGIGLGQEGVKPPFGAHVLCRSDLSDVRFLIEATVVARQIARQSVNIALGAASMSAVVSAGGLLPLTSRRVVSVVNASSLISMFNGLRAARTLARQPVVPLRNRTPFHALSAQGVMRRLGTSELGLSELEVARRRRATASAKPAVVELLEAIADELWNPLAPLLAAGAGLSAVAGSPGDAAIVGAVVAVNAAVGGVQRFRTERRIRRLAEVNRPTTTVHREGKIRNVTAEELVVGDVVVLGSGQEVPADCRVLHAESLELDMSSLTGESLPVVRSALPSFEGAVADRTSMLYAGSAIAAGRVTAVVVAAADQTEAARGAVALRRATPASGVEQRLRSLVDLTAPVALGAGVGLVLAGMLRGRRVEHLVPAGVSLAVAAVPEGLPLLSTAAQLAAARRLMDRNALVRNARCIESLGRVDVLCIDKTGTVTNGQIALAGVSRGAEFLVPSEFESSEHRLIAAAVRAAPDPRYASSHDDPTDVALGAATREHHISVELSAPAWQRSAELPFEPGRACHVVVGRLADGSRLLEIKGACELLLKHAVRIRVGDEELEFDRVWRSRLEQLIDALGRRGLRLLAVAERRLAPDEADDPRALDGLTLLGIAAFSDPVRPSAKVALRRLEEVGVRVVMVTGDHPRTAETIANELSIIKRNQGVVTGAELLGMSDDELDSVLERTAVFARVTPSQKARIVRAFQRTSHVVGMLGDGSNDAAAIRLADVGIAVGEHSAAAARGAADIVLTEARIETVVEAVIEGRAMWASVRQAVSILVGGNLGEIMFTLGAGLVDGRPPLNPRQLLLVNLLTDVAPAMAIALRPPSVETLSFLANEGPETSLAQPLNREIAARAMVTALGAGMAWSVARLTGSAERASTVGLLALVGTQLGQTIVSGGYSRPVITTSVVSTAILATAVQIPGLSRFFGCQPLSPIGWSIAVGSSALATGIAIAFPQVTGTLAGKLGSFDAVLDRKPRPTSLAPSVTSSIPQSVRAVRAVIKNEGLLGLIDG